MSGQGTLQWISHRGLAQHYDENTLAAFRAACESGFSHLETDLRCSRDGHIVLCHDSDLSRLSLSSGIVEQMSRTELEKIQLHKGEKLLFLDEFMLLFKDYHWVFDIKPESAQQTINRLSSILEQNPDLLKKIIFLFWNKQEQREFLNLFPQALCFPRIQECYHAGFAVLFGLAVFAKIKKNKVYSITPKILGLPLLNKRIVRVFHKRNAQVLGYLPETKDETQQCVTAGVDYILTNHAPFP